MTQPEVACPSPGPRCRPGCANHVAGSSDQAGKGRLCSPQKQLEEPIGSFLLLRRGLVGEGVQLTSKKVFPRQRNKYPPHSFRRARIRTSRSSQAVTWSDGPAHRRPAATGLRRCQGVPRVGSVPLAQRGGPVPWGRVSRTLTPGGSRGPPPRGRHSWNGLRCGRLSLRCPAAGRAPVFVGGRVRPSLETGDVFRSLSGARLSEVRDGGCPPCGQGTGHLPGRTGPVVRPLKRRGFPLRCSPGGRSQWGEPPTSAAPRGARRKPL